MQNIDRRSLLASILSTSTLRCLPAPLAVLPAMLGGDPFDDATRPVREDRRRLLTPKFAELAASMRASGGIRPHRHGGVRLERDETFEHANPGKYLIHNYGHGGAGITLSWGCASKVRGMVADIVRQLPRGRTPPTVAILGGGVIGLTVADEVRRLQPRLAITLYRREDNVNKTTSWVAGGQFEPSGIWREYKRPDEVDVPGQPSKPPIEKLAELLTLSKRKLEQLQALPNNGRVRYGVAKRFNYTLDRDNDGFDDATPCSVVPKYRRGLLPFDKLTTTVGRQYDTWLMNPRFLLPTLSSDIQAGGVVIKTKRFTTVGDVQRLPEKIIVNCLGLGAKQVFGDPDLQPRAGHLLILKNPEKLTYFFSGGCARAVTSYMFCRQDDIVVGGTVYKGLDRALDTEVDQRVRLMILGNIRRVFEGHPQTCIRPPNIYNADGQEIEEG